MKGSSATKYSDERENNILHGKPDANPGHLNFDTSTKSDSSHESNEKTTKEN